VAGKRDTRLSLRKAGVKMKEFALAQDFAVFRRKQGVPTGCIPYASAPAFFCKFGPFLLLGSGRLSADL
jgi:hypothetical protein